MFVKLEDHIDFYWTNNNNFVGISIKVFLEFVHQTDRQMKWTEYSLIASMNSQEEKGGDQDAAQEAILSEYLSTKLAEVKHDNSEVMSESSDSESKEVFEDDLESSEGTHKKKQTWN